MAARESAPLAATGPRLPLDKTTGFGRFSPPADLLVGGRRQLDVFDIFDYDGLGVGGGVNIDDYGFDVTTNTGIATGVAARAHPVDSRVVVDRRRPETVAVAAGGGVGFVHPHHPRGGPVGHTRNKKIRLWRKLYYLDYLRKLYAR